MLARLFRILTSSFFSLQLECTDNMVGGRGRGGEGRRRERGEGGGESEWQTSALSTAR